MRKEKLWWLPVVSTGLLLSGVAMARTTYLHKNLVQQSDFTPTLALGVSLMRLLTWVTRTFTRYHRLRRPPGPRSRSSAPQPAPADRTCAAR